MKILKTLLIFTILLFACSDTATNELDVTINTPEAINDPPREVKPSEDYKLDCYRTEYYFCPGVSGPLFRIAIVKDICKDPPEVISISECEEFLECDPSQFKMGEKDCTTDDGLPGKKTIYCDKGHIKEGKCESDCVEEICDGIDNDCDGEVDEGQTNDCGQCGPEPPEICDGIDNDCDGETDEDLVRPCETVCEGGYETCVDGDWALCTAKQPQQEMCDGIDNDCDGEIDEDLDCLCTIQDVGVLIPCEQEPLICGSGFQTCECLDTDCTSLGFTDCYAMCYWENPNDSNCDPLLGKALDFEKCNNHDDNCNELIDEDLYEMCYTGPPETLDVGICHAGLFICEKGKWGNYNNGGYFVLDYCKDETTPELEDQCNGEDENCDGLIDQGEEMQDTDILFILDWSASMGDENGAVLTALTEFAKNYSDEEVIQWGLLIGPKVPGNFMGNLNHLQKVSDLSPFEDFMNSFSLLNKNTMNGQFEMIYDALYISLLGISSSAPWQLDELTWVKMVGNSIKESIPPLEDFTINWRPNAKRVIIIFSDEHGQSYMVPKSVLGGSWDANVDGVTQKILLNMIATAPNTSIYTFSNLTSANASMPYGDTGWEPLSLASGGKWFKLTYDTVTMYGNLMEIIEKEVCE